MNTSFKNDFYNSSAISEGGLEVKNKIEESRKYIASFLGSRREEVIFTSGATESNNLAILGVVSYAQKLFKKPHIISSTIEHASVLEVLYTLEYQNKIELSLIEVDEKGYLDLKSLKKSLRENTVLVSIMYANNEIGRIFDIKEIAKTIRHFRKNKKQNTNYPYFHTDATQATNYLDMNIIRLGVDLMSFNSAKIYGPKSIGVLYKKSNVNLDSVFYGGDQEFGLRPGTLNPALILGLAKALEITNKIKDKEVSRLEKLKNKFYLDLEKVFKKHDLEIQLNGTLDNSLPNILNITIAKIPSDLFLIELSMKGIYISEKSACKTGEKKNSHVIEALYGKTQEKISSLRFSLGRETKKEDLNLVIKTINYILAKLKDWY
jgi:cysteine desulfurase